MPDQTQQLPLRRAETAAVFVLVIQAVAGAVALLLAGASRSAAAEAEAWQLLVGALVWLAALVHQRLRRLADEEAHTAQTLAAPEPGRGASLFESEGEELLTARNRLAQFEKYFLPAFSILIFLALAALSFLLLRGLLTTATPLPVERALMAAVVFFGIAFVTFLLARYTAGLATQAPWRPVRAGANYSISCALGSLLVGLALVFDHFELPVVERVVAYVVPCALGLMAFEVLTNLILGIYRPRVAGQELHPAHDSRLLGALTTRGGVLRATAETLDYQFGFKVSETWFYRFMEQAILPLIFFWLLTFYLLTCFAIVDTGEQAIVERFGRPRVGCPPLGPGLHLTWPWPIEIVRRAPVGRIQMITVGEQLEETAEGYLWTVSHAREPFRLLVANREQEQAAPPKDRAAEATVAVSMLSGGVHVYYTVADIEPYLYTHTDPEAALSAACHAELTRYAAGADFLEFLGAGRTAALAELHQRFQDAADRLRLGVKIIGVSLQGIHPPTEVGEAFEDVIGAMEDREAEVFKAEGYWNEVIPKAEAEAAKVRSEAEAYRYRRQHVSEAIAGRFRHRLAAHAAAPQVFLYRELLSALEEAWADRRKIITPAWVRSDQVIILNLEDKLLPAFDIESSGEGAGP